MITVMVPTLNRPEFCQRLLRYYAQVRFPYILAIGDSSDAERAGCLQAAIRAVEGTIRVRYFDCTGRNDAQTIKFLTEQVETPYAAFVADDDFLIPEGLTAAAQFLDDHADYTAAHGRGIVAVLEASGPYGRFAATGAYRQPELEQATAAGRLGALMSQYSVPLFSVHRTEVWRRMYRQTHALEDKTFTELAAVGLSAAAGKIKGIEGLYLVRQAHDRRYFLPDAFDWVARPQWAGTYAAVQDDLAAAVMEIDGIPRDEAEAAVKKAFWQYLSRILSQRYSQRYKTPEAQWKKKLKSTIKTVPGAAKGVLPRWHSLAARIRTGEDLTLRGLLKTSSVYHRAFKPVYDAVRNVPAKEGVL